MDNTITPVFVACSIDAVVKLFKYYNISFDVTITPVSYLIHSNSLINTSEEQFQLACTWYVEDWGGKFDATILIDRLGKVDGFIKEVLTADEAFDFFDIVFKRSNSITRIRTQNNGVL